MRMAAKKKDSVYAYPLKWPEGWPRAKSRMYSPFKMPVEKSRQHLLDEIERMGGKLPVITTNARLRTDGAPRADENPTDSGVAVYFQRKGKTMVFACDRWWLVKENLHMRSL